MNTRAYKIGGQSKGFQHLWILVIIDLTFQLFNYLPLFDRHYLFWLIGFVLIAFYSRDFWRDKSFLWMFVYLVVVFFNYLSGDSYFSSFDSVFTKEALNFLFPIALTYYLFHKSDYNLFSSFLVFFGLFLLESTIVSYWANSIYPGIIRLQSSGIGIESNKALLRPFQRLGLSDYALPHAIPVFIPGLVYAIKKSTRLRKILLLVLFCTSCILVYASESFTALIVTAMTVLMSFLIDYKSKRNTIRKVVLVGLIMLPLAINTQLQLFTIGSIQSVFPDESLPYKKLDDIQNSIIAGVAEGSVEKRQEKYESTWEAVADNLIMGTNEREIGGHSSIPDRLAVLGLVGMIPFSLFLWFLTKYTLRYLCGISKYYYFVGWFAALIMLFTKNASTLSMWLFLFTLLPGLLWWCDGNNRK